MSVFRPYPNQPVRPNGLAPFQTPAAGPYVPVGCMPGWINRAPDAPRPLLPNGVAAFLSAAAGPYIPVGCEPEQINGGWTPRAILPGAGIAALLPPPASYVAPASIAQPSRALVSPPQLS